MNTSKHTPGPWSVIDNNWEVSSVYGLDDCLIAEVQIHPSVTEENQDDLEPIKEANARLIAAAPDMLEALKAVDALGMLNPTGSGTVEDAARAVKAAIARAEGRS